ncbi:unnamed protein product [Dicrocoelium dendriticum]|nr:unnamed protein product [Dicrocoelium dendriticum]
MSLKRLSSVKPKPLNLQPVNIESKEDGKSKSAALSSNGNVVTKSDDFARIVFLGSARVGKTAIIQRFLHDSFDPKYIPTVEDIHSKKCIVRDRLVRLLLIDTAGSYDFPAMLRLCIAQASAFVIVFSHDNVDSLTRAGQLLSQIKSQRTDYAPMSSVTPYKEEEHSEAFRYGSVVIPPPPVTVVCNKSDLPATHSQVSEGAIMEWLLMNGLKPSQFVYSSAKSNDSIMSIFKSLWTQNELTKAVSFERWNGPNRASFYTKPPRTPSSAPVATDFSAINESMTQRQTVCNADDSNRGESGLHKSRSSIFRNSLRLRRRSSSKSSKAKSDTIKIECVIS